MRAEDQEKGGRSRTPMMRDGDGMVRDQFGGRQQTRKTMNGKDRIGETRGLATSIEVVIADPGTKNLARETKRVKFDDGRNDEDKAGFVEPSEADVRREHILPELVCLSSITQRRSPFWGYGKDDVGGMRSKQRSENELDEKDE